MSGSLVGAETAVQPAVGMGATIEAYSERESVTIVEVKPFQSGPRMGEPRELVVQYDDWTVLRGSESDGSAEYAYTPNPTARKAVYYLALKGRRTGQWVEKGLGGRGWTLALGRRERVHNPRI